MPDVTGALRLLSTRSSHWLEAKRWVWLDVEQVTAEMQAEIVDAASFLAQLLTAEGDSAGAGLALVSGGRLVGDR